MHLGVIGQLKACQRIAKEFVGNWGFSTGLQQEFLPSMKPFE